MLRHSALLDDADTDFRPSRFHLLAGHLREWAPVLIDQLSDSSYHNDNEQLTCDIRSQLAAHVTWLESVAGAFEGDSNKESRQKGGYRYRSDCLLTAWSLVQVLSNTSVMEKAVKTSLKLALPPGLAHELIRQREAMSFSGCCVCMHACMHLCVCGHFALHLCTCLSSQAFASNVTSTANP